MSELLHFKAGKGAFRFLQMLIKVEFRVIRPLQAQGESVQIMLLWVTRPSLLNKHLSFVRATEVTW